MAELEPLLSVRGLEVRERAFRGSSRYLLRGCDLDIHDGETVAVIGATGSGKTALGQALTRLARGVRCRGTVHLRGQPGNLLRASGWRLGRVRGGSIGYLFGATRGGLDSDVPVRAQMVEVLNRHRPEVKQEEEEIVYWLSKAGLVDPENLMSARPRNMDLMVRTRVGIAIAMCAFPQVLVADEPAAELDAANQERILKLLGDLVEATGVAMLVLSRDFRVAIQLAERVVVLREGEIIEQGPLSAIINSPGNELTREILDFTPGR
ncbi:MAG: ATP-binding cassette domain-containing protein [Verrucomicrobiales bacterium]